MRKWYKYRTAGAKELGSRMLGWTAGTGKPGAEQPGQDSWRRQSGWYRQDKKERTGWPEHDRRKGSCDRTTKMGQLWLDSHDSKVGSWCLGHDYGYDVCLDRSAQQISRDRSAMTGQRGQDASTWRKEPNWADRWVPYILQQVALADIFLLQRSEGGRWAGARAMEQGQLGLDLWDKTVRTGQPEKTVVIKTTGKGNRGQDCQNSQNMTVRTGRLFYSMYC